MKNLVLFLQIPWKENGHDYDGVDCAGLVYLFYKDCLKEVFKKDEIPPYNYYDSYKNPDKVFHFLLEKNFYLTDTPRFGDIAVFTYPTLVRAHLGIYVEGNKILHIREKGFSVIERAYRCGSIAGYYTLRKT